MQADLIEQRRGRRLWCSLELLPEDLQADLELAHGLGPLSPPHVAAHHEPVGILAAGLMGEKL
jgi:hypothetical protein